MQELLTQIEILNQNFNYNNLEDCQKLLYLLSTNEFKFNKTNEQINKLLLILLNKIPDPNKNNISNHSQCKQFFQNKTAEHNIYDLHLSPISRGTKKIFPKLLYNFIEKEAN